MRHDIKAVQELAEANKAGLHVDKVPVGMSPSYQPIRKRESGVAMSADEPLGTGDSDTYQQKAAEDRYSLSKMRNN